MRRRGIRAVLLGLSLPLLAACVSPGAYDEEREAHRHWKARAEATEAEMDALRLELAQAKEQAVGWHQQSQTCQQRLRQAQTAPRTRRPAPAAAQPAESAEDRAIEDCASVMVMEKGGSLDEWRRTCRRMREEGR